MESKDTTIVCAESTPAARSPPRLSINTRCQHSVWMWRLEVHTVRDMARRRGDHPLDSLSTEGTKEESLSSQVSSGLRPAGPKLTTWWLTWDKGARFGNLCSTKSFCVRKVVGGCSPHVDLNAGYYPLGSLFDQRVSVGRQPHLAARTNTNSWFILDLAHLVEPKTRSKYFRRAWRAVVWI